MYRRAWLLACALCALTVLPLPAQTRAELRARAAVHRARIDSLVPLYEQASAEYQRAHGQRVREEIARAGALDTLLVGPLRIVAVEDDAASAAAVFERAWAEYEPLLGSAAEQLNRAVFLVRGDDGAAALGPMYTQPRTYVLDLPSIIRYRDRIRVVRAAIGAPLRVIMPAAVQEWLGAGNFGAGLELDRAYRELAIGNARGTELCHDGDIASCMRVLGLTGETNWISFYTPAQLREMVRARSIGGDNYARCVQLREHAACVAALTPMAGRAAVPPPLSAHTRVVLLQHALLRGGEGSFERLIADPDADVRAALTAASGMELTALVASWRAMMLEARPGVAAALGRTLLVTLFWIGLLMTLANRSTRWRIG